MFSGHNYHFGTNMIFTTPAYLLGGVALLVLTLLLLRREKYSRSYLFLFSLSWIYLLWVLNIIIFPIAPLPEVYQDAFRLKTNFTPFDFDVCGFRRICLANIVGNVLLTVPLGFGVSFIAKLRLKDIVWLSILVGVVFETLQLIIALIFRSPFRVIDINDFILNGLGVWLGYLLFRIFGFLYVLVTKQLKLQHKSIFAYVYEVVRHS
jgi:glycopeptide antibiotics resistance protein